MNRTASLVLALILTIPAAASAQPVESLAGEELIRALVREMRLLRMSIQQNANEELRAQVLLQRESRAAERVEQMGQQLEQNFPDDGTMMSEEFDMHADGLRNRLRSETDPEQRRQIETELGMIERRREMSTRHREQMRVRRQQLEQRFEEERARLETLRSELDSLLSDLARDPN